MAEAWIGIVDRAVELAEKKLLDLTKVKYLVARMLESRGRIQYGVDGSYEKKYPVDWREQEPSEFGYGSETTYTPFTSIQKATQTWRGMQESDAMHRVEKEMMKGSAGELVDRYARILPKLIKSMRDNVWKSFVVNGSTSGNENMFNGIATVFGTAANASAENIIATPNTTYHDISTALAQGGSWSSDLTTSPNATLGTDYPEGMGNRDYHFWSPLYPNWSSTNWGTSQTGWSDNCTRVVSRTAMWLRHTHAAEGQLVCLMAPNLMSEWNQYWEAKSRTLPPHAEGERYGFHDTFNYEGVLIQAGYGIPADTAYMFDVDAVKLLMLSKKLVMTEPIRYDEDTHMYKWMGWNLGDYRFVPKFCAQIYNYA